jgi:hypothetical protein
MGTGLGGVPGVPRAGRPEVLWWPPRPNVLRLVLRHATAILPVASLRSTSLPVTALGTRSVSLRVVQRAHQDLQASTMLLVSFPMS